VESAIRSEVPIRLATRTGLRFGGSAHSDVDVSSGEHPLRLFDDREVVPRQEGGFGWHTPMFRYYKDPSDKEGYGGIVDAYKDFHDNHNRIDMVGRWDSPLGERAESRSGYSRPVSRSGRITAT
jgi:hypothetical protein